MGQYDSWLIFFKIKKMLNAEKLKNLTRMKGKGANAESDFFRTKLSSLSPQTNTNS